MMMDAEDQQFINLAVKAHFVSPEIVEECRRIQQSTKPPPLLSTLLLSKGHITGEQYRYLKRMLFEGTHKLDAISKERYSDSLFGNLAVGKGYLQPEHLEKCLQIQSEGMRRGDFARLGKILVEQGYLTVDKVQEILQQQNKSIMTCPQCGVSYNIRNDHPPDALYCKNCGAPLNINRKPTHTQIASSEDWIATRIENPAGQQIVAVLLVVQGPDYGRHCRIPHGRVVTIGRVRGLDFTLTDLAISRVHCKVIATNDRRVKIMDLMSTHGTYVNGVKLGSQEHLLKHKDMIRIGRTHIEFRLEN